jgi:hypothetical protein
VRRYDFQSHSSAEIHDRLLPFAAVPDGEQVFPPVAASYWFPKAADRWPPGHERPSLVVYGGSVMNRCARDESIFAPVRRHDFLGCQALYTKLPYWRKIYGDRLAISLVSQTEGYAVQSVALPPAAEADTLQRFFREQLQLPVTIGVVTKAVRRLPDPDGRQLRSDTSVYGRLIRETHRSTPLVALYDSHGKLVYAGNNLTNLVLQRLIERTVRATVSVSGGSERP